MAVRTTGDLHLTWDVVYQPGTLKAVGTKDGKVAVETEIVTTGDPATISLTLDRESIRPDRRDVAQVAITVADAQGRMAPDADSEINLEIQGPGKLIGFDNGDPASHHDFKSTRAKAFHGMCLAIVESTAEQGQITLTAKSPGLRTGSVVIPVRL
jgi:beta-galactosidase